MNDDLKAHAKEVRNKNILSLLDVLDRHTSANVLAALLAAVEAHECRQPTVSDGFGVALSKANAERAAARTERDEARAHLEAEAEHRRFAVESTRRAEAVVAELRAENQRLRAVLSELDRLEKFSHEIRDGEHPRNGFGDGERASLRHAQLIAEALTP